jgi:cytochrome c556
MVRGINPAATAIWDVGNAAGQDSGGWNPALIDEAGWAKLRDGARELERHSRRMAEADALYVGNHNDEIEGFASKAEIQEMIDADPGGFRDLSRNMAEDAGALLDAATARGARRSADLADGLGAHCGSCHSRYWIKPPS